MTTISPVPLSQPDDLPGQPLAAIKGLVAHLEATETELNEGPIRPNDAQRRAILDTAERSCDVVESHLLRLRRQIRGGWRR